MIKLTFSNDKNTKKFLLSLFNKSVDKEGYIIEEGTNKRVISSDGDEIKLSEFGGIVKGSEIFIKNNIVSLIKYNQRNVLNRAK